MIQSLEAVMCNFLYDFISRPHGCGRILVINNNSGRCKNVQFILILISGHIARRKIDARRRQGKPERREQNGEECGRADAHQNFQTTCQTTFQSIWREMDQRWPRDQNTPVIPGP